MPSVRKDFCGMNYYYHYYFLLRYGGSILILLSQLTRQVLWRLWWKILFFCYDISEKIIGSKKPEKPDFAWLSHLADVWRNFIKSVSLGLVLLANLFIFWFHIRDFVMRWFLNDHPNFGWKYPWAIVEAGRERILKFASWEDWEIDGEGGIRWVKAFGIRVDHSEGVNRRQTSTKFEWRASVVERRATMREGR